MDALQVRQNVAIDGVAFEFPTSFQCFVETCESDADCDDDAACTDDSCVDNTCMHTSNDDNCADGEVCNSATGECVVDQDPCECVNGRVTLSHRPPGNLSNARTITVNMRALPAHLAHGDFCGSCEGRGAVLLLADESEACSADLNTDDLVDANDLATLLGSWGPCADPPDPCPADIFGTENGFVSADDLAVLLANWGPCE